MWGPFDECGKCICDCCKGTCPREYPCYARRASTERLLTEQKQPLAHDAVADPYGEMCSAVDGRLDEAYDESEWLMAARSSPVAEYASADWQAQHEPPSPTTADQDPYEGVPDHAFVSI